MESEILWESEIMPTLGGFLTVAKSVKKSKYWSNEQHNKDCLEQQF
jgi:hypothetical protein